MSVQHMDPNGPAGPWPMEAVAARNRMVDFENALEAAAQRLYPGAVLREGFSPENPTGTTTLTLTANGTSMVLPVFQIATPWLTPEQWLAQNVPTAAPVPPPIRRDPGKVLDVAFEEIPGSGKWFKYSGPFEFKVACHAPAGAPVTTPNTAASTKSRTIAAIGRILSVQPPKPQPEVDDFQALAVEVNAFPE